MDRRRFVPAPEGLEGRSLLSAFSLKPSQNLIPPSTVQAKNLRIERLPQYLNTLQPGRFLQEDTVKALQADLEAIKGQLHTPAMATKDNFDHQIRATLPNETIHQDDAARLNQAFATVLTSAGASETQVDRFRQDMNDLVRVDALSPNSARLVANDYALLTQVALSVGRPIRTPARPQLLAADDTGIKGDHKTTNPSPRFEGTYDKGATIDLINLETNQILGTTTVANNGRYLVAVSQPLNPGTYSLAVRATSDGVSSEPSSPFSLMILPKTPISPPRAGSSR
ncbi:MAG: carboxypeptidase regulatory-like domain-containing protein [Isosphaeraceae bacterium]|nr:carboxypeptidase regulatory-like domain-containing protein [Isosphaeraceae bacterium]